MSPSQSKDHKAWPAAPKKAEVLGFASISVSPGNNVSNVSVKWSSVGQTSVALAPCQGPFESTMATHEVRFSLNPSIVRFGPGVANAGHVCVCVITSSSQ